MKGSKMFYHENTKFKKHEIIRFRALVLSCFRGEILAFHFNRLWASIGVK